MPRASCARATPPLCVSGPTTCRPPGTPAPARRRWRITRSCGWAARGAGLITGLLATTPVWRQIDPLPVMLTPQDHDDGDDSAMPDDNTARAEALFGEQRSGVDVIG